MYAASRFRRLREFQRHHVLLSDALFAAAMYAFLTGSLAAFMSAGAVPEEFGWTEAAWTAVGMTPIVTRRKWPWVSIALVYLSLVLVTVLDQPWIVGDNGATWFIITYTFAANQPVLRALVMAGAVWFPASAWLSLYFWSGSEAYSDLTIKLVLTLTNMFAAATAFFVGWVIRNRRIKLAELSDRARVAEETQTALAAQAVADEQRRIARELHDVVAHHISVIGVMSEGAKRVLRTDPEAAEDALTTVNQTARTALREMRDILAVLRQGHDEGGADLEPQPTVDSLRALVAQTKEAGLPVRYSVRGEEYPLPTGVSLAVYRIVQEALTNTIKHAGPRAKAGVVVDYGATEFSVSIGDSGRGAPVTGGFAGGHGLIGMRERATLYGGSLLAGPQPGGGYLVEARFPKNAHLQGVDR